MILGVHSTSPSFALLSCATEALTSSPQPGHDAPKMSEEAASTESAREVCPQTEVEGASEAASAQQIQQEGSGIEQLPFNFSPQPSMFSGE